MALFCYAASSKAIPAMKGENVARFYGVLRGQAGEATRLGSPKSGLVTECRGWDAGVTVCAHADGDRDLFDVYLTGGSNGSVPRTHLGTIGPDENGRPVLHLTRKFKVEMDGADPVVTVAA